jgi:hypothetical protein
MQRPAGGEGWTHNRIGLARNQGTGAKRASFAQACVARRGRESLATLLFVVASPP